MAIKTFRTGKVSVEGNDITTGMVENASLNLNVNPGEVHGIGDDWRKLVALARSWTVTLTVKTNPSDTAYAAIRTEMISGDLAMSALQVWEDASHYFSGSALLTNFAPGKAVGGVDTTSITFEGTGAMAYT